MSVTDAEIIEVDEWLNHRMHLLERLQQEIKAAKQEIELITKGANHVR